MVIHQCHTFGSNWYELPDPLDIRNKENDQNCVPRNIYHTLGHIMMFWMQWRHTMTSQHRQLRPVSDITYTI